MPMNPATFITWRYGESTAPSSLWVCRIGS